MRTRLPVAAAAAGLVLLAGCGGTPSGTDARAPGTPEQRTLTVFAAASLTESFGEIEKQFETDNPGVDVVPSYGGSSDLAQQIVNGAPADVFASASDATMTTVTDAGLADGAPAVFATNVLVIATAAGNPKGITSFADLAKPDLKVVVCAPQVPCGAAARKVETATGVDIKPVSEETDVKNVLGKVTTGNADAGLVYVTDVASAGSAVEGVTFPEAAKATTAYPIAVIRNAPQAELARSFVSAVTGEQGQKVLQAAGFGTP
ncbi:molybdate ABC transporter substrate-binding protein [Pseudonocardia xinjiangensis]|uniref:Molybdate ABC transporter substrate-binding protein n=1 Tax=Pseudonocardia xinjiangensis TaxID=75289 RepID=A0ABX1RE68_9PSEU|nr:molybdate ABC transporter substrate-binding protein [Pseudonocardia xinjiangensis]NMH77420.1 molybdate ABC transporter substrate-binding protein [Pseudonocardia xinjiangensis]